MSITLQNKQLCLFVAPDVGASVAGFEFFHEDRWQPIMRPTATPWPAVSSNYSSFTLAPYSNRIRAARFQFGSETHQLKVTTPDGNSQHGDVRNRPWRVLTQTETTVECEFDSRTALDVNWPWPFRVAKRYELRDAEFITTIEMTNLGETSMPAGFGFHPYFTRSLGDAALQFDADGYYHTDQTYLPSGAMIAMPSELDCSRGRTIGAQQFNHCFGGWHQQAHLRWKDVPFSLRIAASAEFQHIVVFTAPDGTLAIEPVTNCTDGFNLYAQGIQGTGVRVLQPGEVLTGQVAMEIAMGR